MNEWRARVVSTLNQCNVSVSAAFRDTASVFQRARLIFTGRKLKLIVGRVSLKAGVYEDCLCCEAGARLGLADIEITRVCHRGSWGHSGLCWNTNGAVSSSVLKIICQISSLWKRVMCSRDSCWWWQYDDVVPFWHVFQHCFSLMCHTFSEHFMNTAYEHDVKCFKNLKDHNFNVL